MKLRCISLWQPWASLIAAGVKIHETRGFMPPAAAIGEPLGIHAAKRPVHPTELSPALKRICFETFGGGGWPLRLPRGGVICRGVLAAARPVLDVLAEVDSTDRLADVFCGYYAAGRYAWRIEDVQPVLPVFPCRALQGWFYVDL